MKKKFENWLKQVPENKIYSVMAGSMTFTSIFAMDTFLFDYSPLTALIESSFLATVTCSLTYFILQTADKEERTEKQEKQKNRQIDKTNYFEELKHKSKTMYTYKWGADIVLGVKAYLDAIQYVEKHCSATKEEMRHLKTVISKQIWEVLMIFEKMDTENKEQMMEKIVYMLQEKHEEIQNIHIKPYQKSLVTSCEKKLEEIAEQKQERIYVSE